MSLEILRHTAEEVDQGLDKVTELEHEIGELIGKPIDVIASKTTNVTGNETSNITLLTASGLSLEAGEKIYFYVPNFAMCARYGRGASVVVHGK